MQATRALLELHLAAHGGHALGGACSIMLSAGFGALANLTAELAGRTPLVIRITEPGVVSKLEYEGKLVLDVPLIQHDPDPMVRKTYIGDQSAQLCVTRFVLGSVTEAVIHHAPSPRWSCG